MNKAQFHPQHSDWNLVRSFIAVAEHGSLTRAAEVLGLSQATLSRQISELEENSGQALFERVARGLELTEAGQRLLEPARFMLSAARGVEMAISQQSLALAGSVRITASETVAAFVLPEILAKLAEQHPEIQIEVVASNQVSNLLEREADIAIRMMRPQQSGLITRHLCDWGIGFYAHHHYLKRQQFTRSEGKKLNWREHRWIGLDQSDRFVQGFREAGIKIDRYDFDIRCDNHLVNWQMLQAGLGIGVAPHWLARQNEGLVAIDVGQKIPDLPVWLTSHRELKSNLRIRTVFDFLADEILAFAASHSLD
ncbi:LysR family transcriptional regulator [Undibacterium cyanobacteriorum]|uniref:LysR family transcriptional regulator n=1 Tax=Undibacterium cyanobacteriorum TaxID=3073561 RepID=A0ABY9RI09_9BURK|nr:LysR family transcriptional regulator [Undibacterium sp. 20NA77.5]WMW80849.1 LysR family transcriptional regulator [Undibacterium sp. 20NA77.5]